LVINYFAIKVNKINWRKQVFFVHQL
jgi:hypothetical protein